MGYPDIGCSAGCAIVSWAWQIGATLKSGESGQNASEVDPGNAKKTLMWVKQYYTIPQITIKDGINHSQIGGFQFFSPH